jgi:PAS domain S-box-containing protein
MLGDDPYALAVVVDLTPRRKTEEALRQSEARLRQLAEPIQEAFWLTDPDQNKVLYISPAHETIWGRSCARLYDSSADWSQAAHPDDRSRVLDVLPKQLLGT